MLMVAPNGAKIDARDEAAERLKLAGFKELSVQEAKEEPQAPAQKPKAKKTPKNKSKE